MHDWNWHYWGAPMMWLIWIPLIILVVWMAVKLINTGKSSELNKESPLEILKRKYANGEITAEEYEQRKRVLEKD